MRCVDQATLRSPLSWAHFTDEAHPSGAGDTSTSLPLTSLRTKGMNVMPCMYGTRASGTRRPSGVWWFSSTQQSVRSVAVSVLRAKQQRSSQQRGRERESARGGGGGAPVEQVHVGLLAFGPLLGRPAADLQAAGLVVRAVGARHQLAERLAGRGAVSGGRVGERMGDCRLHTFDDGNQASRSYFLAAALLSAPDTMLTTL